MTAIDRPEWADRMLSALDSAGLCEADLAALLGETPDDVARFLDGDKFDEDDPIGVHYLDALACVRHVTGVSAYWLVTGKADASFDLRLN